MNARKKILTVIPTLDGAGAQRVVSVLTQEWAKSHRVTIALFDASRTAYDYGGRIVNLRVPGSSNILRKLYNAGPRLARLIRLIRRERPDRIVSFLESANFPTLVAAALTGYLGRLSVSVHNNPVYFSTEYRALIPLLYRFPTRVIAISKGGRDALVRMGVPAHIVVAIPNPVDIPSGVAENALLSPLPVPFILGVGRLHQVKGFDRLLTAFSRLNRSELHLAILGEGSEKVNLIRHAQKLKVEERVHFQGHVADVESWYRHAECFVLSSYSEGWANVLMEAMANKCPVVSFDCPYGPSEIIEDGQSGLLVPEGDVGALAAALARVLDDKTLRRDLVVNGEERVKKFDVKEIAPRWLGLGA